MTEKKIDLDWKNRVLKEKEALAAKTSATDPEESLKQEALFMSLVQSLLMKIEMLLDAGRLEDGKQVAETIMALDAKTQGNQTLKEKNALSQLKMQFKAAGLVGVPASSEEETSAEETD